MAGPIEGAGLTTDIISELQPQGQMPPERDVGTSSVVPDEIESGRRDIGRGATEAISPKPDGGEGLDRRPQPQIADIVE